MNNAVEELLSYCIVLISDYPNPGDSVVRIHKLCSAIDLETSKVKYFVGTRKRAHRTRSTQKAWDKFEDVSAKHRSKFGNASQEITLLYPTPTGVKTIEEVRNSLDYRYVVRYIFRTPVMTSKEGFVARRTVKSTLMQGVRTHELLVFQSHDKPGWAGVIWMENDYMYGGKNNVTIRDIGRSMNAKDEEEEEEGKATSASAPSSKRRAT
jgi:hypothetical protein